MAYDFVYTDQLESVYRKTFESSLSDYESSVRQTLLKNRGNYELLKKRYSNPVNDILANSQVLDSFHTNSLEVFNTIRRFSILSYKLGGQHSYRDFSLKKSFNIVKPELYNILDESLSYHNSITFLYTNLLQKLVYSSIKNDKGFDHLIEAFDGYHDFNKADSPKYGDLPSKGNILQNIATRLVSFWNTAGRVMGYKKMNIVESLQYMTRQDERVSSICAPWHGRVLGLKEAAGLIPQHRNCRCTLVPFR